jgi:hypothetical protein
VLVNIINFTENFLRLALTVVTLFFLTMFALLVDTIKENKLSRLKLKLIKQLKLKPKKKIKSKKPSQEGFFVSKRFSCSSIPKSSEPAATFQIKSSRIMILHNE